MNVAIADMYTLPSTTVLNGILSAQLLEKMAEELVLEIAIDSLNFNFETKSLSITRFPDGQTIEINTTIENSVILIFYLKGELSIDETVFNVATIDLRFQLLEETPQAEFISSSLRASLALADKAQLRISAIGLDVYLKFYLPLNEISQMLERRQTAYKFMVIEKATNLKFHLPLFITGKDLSNIDFVYSAIKEKSFIWPIQTVDIFVPANANILTLLPHNNPIDLPISNDSITKTILGTSVFLGDEIFVIKDAVTMNFKEVQAEMTSNDNHKVKVTILSLTGQSIYTYPDSPNLSDNSWNYTLSKLIALEQALDNALANGYNELAAATLKDLTEEEKEEILPKDSADENTVSTNASRSIIL